MIVVLMAFALSASTTFAQDSQCLSSVTGSASANTITTGTDFSISVTPASSSSDCSVSTLTLSGSPTSYTISDPPSSQSNQYSGFTAGTTKTFTVSVGSAGTYTFTPTATTSAGSMSGTGIIVSSIDPSTLTTSASPSAAQLNRSQSLTLIISITGSSSADVTTSYSLNVPSGLNASGDPTTSSAQSVTANSTTSLTWTINHTTCYTGGKTITFGLGSNTNAVGITVTGNSSCDAGGSSSSGSGSGSGGTSGATLSAKTAKISVAVASSGATKVIDVGLKSNDTSVRRLEFTTSSSAAGMEFLIDKVSSRPSFVSVSPPSGSVFGYIVINLTNLSDSQLSGAKLDFAVNKSWLSSNSVDKNKIALYRLSGSTWTKLDTVIFLEETDNIVYRATSPGLSVFAIWGESPAAPANQTNQTAAPPGGEQPPAGEEPPVQPLTNGTLPPPPPGRPLDPGTAMIYIGAVAVVLILIGGYFAFKKKSKGKYEYQKNRKE